MIFFSIFVICTLQQSTSDNLEGTDIFSEDFGSVKTHRTVRESETRSKDADVGLDILQPYTEHHGPKHRTHRQVRECQDVRYGNVTHSKILSHGFNKNISLPIATTRHKIHVIQETYYTRRDVLMHFSVINNPFRTVSVLEPKREGGCQEDLRATVLESSEEEQCIVAINAGFFNTTSGGCIGNCTMVKHLRVESEKLCPAVRKMN